MVNSNRRLSAQFGLRLPEGMRDQIARVADANKRSMNAEIIARLEQSLSLNSTEAHCKAGKQNNEIKVIEYKLDEIDQLIEIISNNQKNFLHDFESFKLRLRSSLKKRGIEI